MSSYQEMPGITSLSRGKTFLAAVLVFLVLFSIITAYYQSFSGIASYDDEGTLIGWIRATVAGQPLYDRIQTPYGPLYFAYEWLAHTALGIPVSNNSVRFVTPFFRVAAVLLFFLLSFKMTGSILVSWGACVVAFGELSFLAREPAHPQELCIVLLIGLALAGCYTADRTRLTLVIGALGAAMALTKINLGIFAVAAVGVAFTYSTSNTRLWSAARALVAGAALMLPTALMVGMLGQPWAMRYCALLTLSLAAALVVVSRVPTDVRLGVRDFMVAAFGFGASLVLISSFAIVRGSSLAAMIECLVLVPRKAFGPVWFFAAHIAAPAIPWAIFCLGLAWCAATGRLNANLVAGLKLLLAVLVLGFCLSDRPGLLMSYASPLLWLVAIPGGGDRAGPAGNFARALLLLISVIQCLYAFPVAGEQMLFTEICPIAVAAVCLADALRHLESRLPQARIPANRKMATVIASGLLASLSCFIGWSAVQLYYSRPPLEVRGAHLIHLNFQDARAIQEIVRLAHVDSCDKLLTVPGMPSFSDWTALESPPSVGTGPWILYMTTANQTYLARKLSADTHTCVIVNKVMADLWSAKYVAYSSPIAQFIRDNFRPEFESGNYKFLVRR